MKHIRGKLKFSPEIIKLESGKNKAKIIIERPNKVADIFCIIFGNDFDEARKSGLLISRMPEILETLEKFMTYVNCEEYEKEIREAKRLITIK